MIDFIIGKIEEKDISSFTILSNNIGYKISASLFTLSELEVGTETKVYIDMVVREDDISLFGFSDTTERDVYKLLNTVKGIGPRLSLQALSGISYETIILSIKNEDVTGLTKAPGIGKKTAERIILELKDKVDGFNFKDELSIPKAPAKNSVIIEATDGLVMLGFMEYEVSEIISEIYEDGMSVEILIKEALKKINR